MINGRQGDDPAPVVASRAMCTPCQWRMRAGPVGRVSTRRDGDGRGIPERRKRRSARLYKRHAPRNT